jgi:hypothetical protein
MDWGYIINRSLSIAWNYKSLWVFGLFAGSSPQFNISYKQDLSNIMRDWYPGEQWLPEFSWEMIGGTVLAILLLMALFIIIHLITFPALVDGVNRVERGGVYRFSDSFSRGIDFVWRYLGISLIEFFIGLTVMAAMVILVWIFTGGELPYVLLGILFVSPFAIVIAFVMGTIFSLAERTLIVRDCSIADALSEGFVLLRRNLGDCIIMALIYIALAIGVGLGLSLIAAILYWPINALVRSLVYGEIQVLIAAFALGLPISLAVGGFGGTFFTNIYTMFYFELVDPAAHRGAGAAPPQETNPAVGPSKQ